MTERRRRRPGSRLFAIYAAASLVPVSVLGIVLVNDYRAAGLEHGRDQGRAQAAVIAEMAITPALRGLPLSEGLSDAELARMRSATDLSIFSGSVRHLRLRSFAGAVAFSDDGSSFGVVPAPDPAFQRAVTGGTDVRIVAHAHQPEIRVLQPVIAASTGKATGVLEIYLPYEAIADKTRAETQRAITRLSFGLIGLYALLAAIAWGTTAALRRHAAAHEHQSLHDSLTGLPNREFFRRTVEDALARSRHGEQGALVLVDLDRFKEVNDTLGHPAGDELLRIVGHRLVSSLRTDDTVARLGGDEFGFVLPRIGDRADAVALLTKVRRELSQEVVLGGVPLVIGASFGVSFYPRDADSVESLLHHADAAMYQGKRGRTGIVVHEPESRSPGPQSVPQPASGPRLTPSSSS